MSRVSAGLVAATVLAIAPSAAGGQTEGRFSADVAATIGYSNNPFSVAGTDTGSVLATIDITPRYQALTERSTFTVSADASLQQYLRRYGFTENFSGALDYVARLSERVTAHGRLDVSSAVLGSADTYPASGGAAFATSDAGTATAASTVGATTVLTPVSTPVASLVPITDIQLYGLRNRRNKGIASADLSFAASARDTLTVAGSAEATRYENLRGSDFEAYSGSVGYSRRVSDRLNLGLRGSVSAFDYRTAGNDSRSYSIQATASDRLNQVWTVDGALGASFVNGGGALSTHSTSVSGNIDLCRHGPLSTLCLQAARQVSPTGLAVSQYVTSAGLNWSHQFDKRQTLLLAANYSKIDSSAASPIAGALPYQSEYIQTSANYARPLGERLRLTASANYRQFLGNGNAGRPQDFGGMIGLAYRFGDRR